MREAEAAYDELGKISSRLAKKGISRGDIGLAMLRSGSVLIRSFGGYDLLLKALDAILDENDPEVLRRKLRVVGAATDDGT